MIRYGGDEFLIFSKIGEQNGYEWGQRLKREVEDYEFWVDKKSQERQKITISCGVCIFKLENTPEIFLEKLSTALMCAKKNEDGSDKKNFVVFID